MDIKNKIKTWWSKLTVKSVNRTFGIVVFILVFLFTFLYGFQFQAQWKILLAVFCPLVGVVGIAWLTIGLLIHKRNQKRDPNKQKIDKAIKSFDEKHSSKTIDESNN